MKKIKHQVYVQADTNLIFTKEEYDGINTALDKKSWFCTIGDNAIMKNMIRFNRISDGKQLTKIVALNTARRLLATKSFHTLVLENN